MLWKRKINRDTFKIGFELKYGLLSLKLNHAIFNGARVFQPAFSSVGG
jgi:hypothetical protein